MRNWSGSMVIMLALGCSGQPSLVSNPPPQGVTGISGTMAPTGSAGTSVSPVAISGGSMGAGTGATAGTAGTTVVASGTGGTVSVAIPKAGNGSASGTDGGQSTAGASDGTAGSAGTSGSGMPTAGSAGDPMPTMGFPAVSDTSAKGPFTAVTIRNTGPSNAYTVFHPKELAPSGALNPVVTWGNGAVTTPADYPLLPHLATHGFVVVAANDSAVTAAEVKAGLDWIVERNADSNSPFYKKLDLKRIGGVGYSLGGLATLGNADDARYVTLVIISGASMNDDSRMMNIPKLHTPVAYLCTADDASQGNCANDYAIVKVPAFFAVMNGSAHTDVTSFLGLGVPAIQTRLAAATTAWLRWQLLDDASQKSKFVGADCGLCKDSNWTVKPQKNLD